jgi:pimeloyl-ACP methyl ester carboxylesterase
MNCPHPARFTHALLFNVRQVFRSWYMFFFQLPGLPEWWLSRRQFANIKRAFRGMTTRPESFGPEVLNAYAQNAAQPGALTAMLNYYRAMFSPANLFRKWRRITVPTLVIWGEQDAALGIELLAGTQRYFPELSIRKIPNASHWVQQDAPEEVNACLEGFLGGD